jgi:hypothetical protein
MERPTGPDLSGAYSDQDQPLSWLQLFGVVLYTLTIGWVCVAAHAAWLWATSRYLPTPTPLRLAKR